MKYLIAYISNDRELSALFGEELSLSFLDVYGININYDRNWIEILLRTSVSPVLRPKKWDKRLINTALTLKAQGVKSIKTDILKQPEEPSLDITEYDGDYVVVSRSGKNFAEMRCIDLIVTDIHPF